MKKILIIILIGVIIFFLNLNFKWIKNPFQDLKESGNVITNLVTLKKPKKKAFEENVKIIIKGIEYQMLNSDLKIGNILNADMEKYGVNPDNYINIDDIAAPKGTVSEITSLNPITVVIISEKTSEFGSLMAIGTENNLEIK